MKDAGKLLHTSTDTTGIEQTLVALRYGYLEEYYKKIGDYKQAYHYSQEKNRINSKLQAEQVRNRIDVHKMRYKTDTTILRRDWKIQVQNEEINSLRLYQLVWALVSVIVLGGLAVGIVFYRKKQNLRAVQFTNKIIQLKLEGVRRRISPHFIFNALNRLVLSSESEHDREELQKLTVFLRKGVDISDNLSISLADELNFVLMYVRIECQGFGSDFSLVYEPDDSIDLSMVSVPAMIVQIPVENAIKHALRTLNGKKELLIKVVGAEGGVCIEITDNGPGYHPQVSGRIGVGLKTIYQTIQMLNSVNEGKIKFDIQNRTEQDACGVSVKIFIPYNFKYNL